MTDEKPHDLLTPFEVAALFRVDIRTVARWVKQGRLKFVQLPSGHRRYRRKDIEQMLESK